MVNGRNNLIGCQSICLMNKQYIKMMNNKIDEEEVSNLKSASMKFPTWRLMNVLIQEAEQQTELLMNKFGNRPMACNDNTLVSVSGTNEVGNHEFVGIDVPVLLSPSGDGLGKTIVIVGESPLRDTVDSNNKGNVLLGTPYAVHQIFNCPSQCNLYKMIFSKLLASGYSIYLTDIIKVWWKGKELKTDDTDMEIFENEIKWIKENMGESIFIVAWGKRAADSMRKKKYRYIKLPHPSQNNWNNWKLFIFEKAIYEKKDIAYATKKYPTRSSKTNEVIVANEAVTEIYNQICLGENTMKH